MSNRTTNEFHGNTVYQRIGFAMDSKVIARLLGNFSAKTCVPCNIVKSTCDSVFFNLYVRLQISRRFA